eukprot:1116350-Heterocapsa_arctica.AAC.1
MTAASPTRSQPHLHILIQSGYVLQHSSADEPRTMQETGPLGEGPPVLPTYIPSSGRPSLRTSAGSS